MADDKEARLLANARRDAARFLGCCGVAAALLGAAVAGIAR